MMETELSEGARLGYDTVLRKPVRGIPTFSVHVMEHECIDALAGVPAGSYVRAPEETYLALQRAAGTCVIVQWIPTNPLTMEAHGFEGTERGATTGADRVTMDGIVIDSPESVVRHMQEVAFPRLRRRIAEFNEDSRTREIIEGERAVQRILAPTILKAGYEFVRFPCLGYGTYGYVPYFTAYALYPEVMEEHFRLQADHAVLNNRAAARAYREGRLPPFFILDHDMADSTGTLASLESLDRLWLPHFARSIEPVAREGVQLIWHCDGNLMGLFPRLLESGVRGFQGFQYEAGMDYEKICRMRTRDGEELIIVAGVSVTRTLPFGTPADVRREMDWLVSRGPRTGLFLTSSSSITPGVPLANLKTFLEGLRYYREHGRS
jgi:hypothetical protein